ncbi:hypothetical protein FA13DRAFT_1452981 [Coprinellus micaceus]|uniref:F-box domain-containing protein n=1 Tax=Coprinellus micaceus TaxID=71717 RepID=A0A4Y7SPT9_COPMI|nr:hypothetical protein FA13DRAFT_1452981 [Coprinellus micaceus]
MATPHRAQTSPLPSLKTTATSNITLPTSPDSVTPFTHLSSLQMPNNLPDTASLWEALCTAGINLQTIKVERLSVPLLDYLSGYRGLRAFQLGGYSSDYGEVTEDGWMDFRTLRQRLLSSGILKHRATFVDLRFCVSRDPSTVRRWESSIFCPSPNIVASMHSFRALERLDVVADTKVGGLHLLRTVCFRVIGLGLPRR